MIIPRSSNSATQILLFNIKLLILVCCLIDSNPASHTSSSAIATIINYSDNNHNQNGTCLQLNITLLDPWAPTLRSDISSSGNITYRCTSIRQALHFLMVDYVARKGCFWLPDDNSAESCWASLLASIVSQNVSMAMDSVQKECSFSSKGLTLQGLDERCGKLTDVAAITKELQLQTPAGDKLISRSCINASSTRLSACSACTQAMVQAMTTDKFFMQPASSASSSSCVGRPLITCQDILPIFAASTQPDTASRIAAATCLLNFNLTNPYSKMADGINPLRRHVTFLFGSLGATVTLFVFALVFLVALYFHRRHIKHLATTIYSRHKPTEKESRAKSSSHLTWYTIDEIKSATHNFSSRYLLGTGGFGSVYKGILPDGTEVAVKRFKNCLAGSTGDEEFFHEVEMLSSVRHKNLVGVRGCCVDRTLSEATKSAAITAWIPQLHRRSGRRQQRRSSDEVQVERMIVYEFMPNGSLQDHLSRESGRAAMDWRRRKHICVGIVRGIAYLHREVRPAIVHRDIKSSNILLDAAWNARVADFGLAKFTPEGATHVTTRVAGTFGYVAPEYVLYGKLNEKSDVYSLGVLLLELLSGRKIIGSFRDVGEEEEEDQTPSLITDWAWDLIRQGHIQRIVDPLMRIVDRQIAGAAAALTTCSSHEDPLDDVDRQIAGAAADLTTSSHEDSLGDVDHQIAGAAASAALTTSREVELEGEWRVIEKFVCIGVLCAHPHVTCRPSIEDVVKLIETETPLPHPLPDRPPPFTAFNICGVHAMADSSTTSSSHFVNFHASSSTSSGFCSYTYDHMDLAR